MRPGDETRLIELMEGVEDIPGTALHEGIQWEWETFPSTSTRSTRREYAIDVAAFLPHAPLRVYVMGERGERNEDATAEDIAAMASHVREAIARRRRRLLDLALAEPQDPRRRARPRDLRRATTSSSGSRRRWSTRGGGLFEVVPHGRDRRRRRRMILGEIELHRPRSSQATGAPVSFLLIQSRSARPTCGASSSRRWRRPNADGRAAHPAGRRPGPAGC